MLASSAPFASMVGGTEQSVAWKVSIALPGGVYPDLSLAVSALHIDAVTTTDITEQQRMQAGYDSTQCTFTLSGQIKISEDESKSAAWLFNPYSTTSPLYRSDAFAAAVTVDLGVVPAGAGGTAELLRKFTGTVDEYVSNPDGTVQFTCLDERNSFRSVPDLPPVITVPPFNAGLTSEFAVDRLLRAASDGAVSSWPAVRPSCVLAVGGRASAWAEVGTLVSVPIGTLGYATGAYGTALSPADQAQVLWALSGSVGDDMYVEFVMSSVDGFGVTNISLCNGTDPNVGDALGIETSPTSITVAPLRNGAAFSGSDYTFTVPTAFAHFVSVKAHWAVGATTWSGVVTVDGTTHTSGSLAAGFTRSAQLDHAAYTSDKGGLEAFQVTTETSPVSNYPFTPRAVLDPSLNPLQAVPAIPAGDPYTIIQTIADAEQAVAGFDENGIFTYRNRNTLRGQSSARDITSSASLADLAIDWNAAAVVNRAQIGYTGWEFAATNTNLWQAAKVLKVAAKTSRNITVNLSGTAASIDNAFGVLANGSSDTAHSHYRASTTKDGAVKHPGITVTAALNGADQAIITLDNTAHPVDAYLVSSSDFLDVTPGTPILWLAGLVATTDDEQVADFQWPYPENGGAASSRFGEVAYQNSGNIWLQDQDAAQQLAVDIVTSSYVPRPDLTGVTIIPDPRLQLMDRVHIIDTHRTGVDEYALIFGITTDWSPARYTMTIDARTVSAPGGWIGGVAGRSEGALTSWGY